MRILERSSFKDGGSGWIKIFKIGGEKVSQADYETEMKRICLLKREFTPYGEENYITSGNGIEVNHKTTIQYLPLPFYRN